jgi:hypothetical protein
MKKTTVAVLLALSTSAFVPVAFADINSLTVSPNPARFSGVTPPHVSITVTVGGIPGTRPNCEVIVDPGDGTAATTPRLDFGVATRTRTMQHTYRTPGTYRLQVKGSGGCGGSRETTVTVQPAPVIAAQMMNVKLKCPNGWSVVPNSINGPNFTCRPNPPLTPIACEGGSTYFTENGVIGCR